MSAAYVPEPGHRVTIRRWEVPCPELPGIARRRLAAWIAGTVEQAEPLAGGLLLTLAGQPDPVFTGDQFTGQDPEHGCSWTLRTTVTRRTDATERETAANREFLHVLLACKQPALATALESVIAELAESL